MTIESVPRSAVPRDLVVENSVRHHVRDGESWDSLAERYGVPADAIIMANFKTLVPAEVNWYLHHYVGCKRPTRDGLNWMFSSSAVPGIVQIPPKTFTLEEIVIVGTPPPRYYTVTVEPSKWTPPPGDGIDPDDAKEVVKIDPWRHGVFIVGAVRIKGRSEWWAANPVTGERSAIARRLLVPLLDSRRRALRGLAQGTLFRRHDQRRPGARQAVRRRSEAVCARGARVDRALSGTKVRDADA
jgi:hypothetical protein